jgi:hypothetical protein
MPARGTATLPVTSPVKQHRFMHTTVESQAAAPRVTTTAARLSRHAPSHLIATDAHHRDSLTSHATAPRSAVIHTYSLKAVTDFSTDFDLRSQSGRVILITHLPHAVAL